MRYRRHVSDRQNFDSQCVQCTNSRFASGSRTLYAYLKVLDATLLRCFTGRFCSNLRGKRCGFTRALEACTSRRSPRQGVARPIGNGDDRIIERRVNVRDAFRHILFDLLAYARCSGWFYHADSFTLNFYFARRMALRGPLRVRALVRVR